MPGLKLQQGLPTWLGEGSAVQSLLSNPPSTYENSSAQTAVPRRTIALRDTDVFVAVGKEIRCADLKDFKAQSEKGMEADYKVLDVQVSYDVHQLEISANGTVMALIGEHDLSICLLPDISRPQQSGGRLRTRCITVGSRDLQIEKQRIVRALWHPMGAAMCLVVVTDDSIIRVYELEWDDEGTFYHADKTLDLNLLSGNAQSTGFSFDDDLQPSTVCFGSADSVWSPFTLYILMRGGDIYSLCPLVPAKWIATEGFMEELRYELNTLVDPIEVEGEETTPLNTFKARQQSLWIEETFRSKQSRRQDASKSKSELDTYTEIMIRPHLSDHVTPLLQGPYLLQPAPKEACNGDVFACDLVHIASDSYAVLAILYSNGVIDIFTEFEPCTPRWISKTIKYKRFNDRSPYPVISGVESVNLKLPISSKAAQEHWPVFTYDKLSSGTLLVNHNTGVELISFDGWMSEVSQAIDEEDDPAALKKVFDELQGSQVVHVIGRQKGALEATNAVTGSAIIYDAFLGYIILAAGISKPSFAVLELPSKFKDMLELEFKMQNRERAPSVSIKQEENEQEEAFTMLDDKVIKSYRDQLKNIGRNNPSANLQAPVTIEVKNHKVLEEVKTVIMQELEDRQDLAQDIFEKAMKQRDLFLDQLEGYQSAVQKAADLRKTMNAQIEKTNTIKKRQAELNTRVSNLLSKLTAVSQDAGYKGFSKAEEEWFNELQGMKSLLAQVKRKKDKMQQSVDEISTKDVDEIIDITPSTTSIGGIVPLRQDTKAELDKLLDKEHVMIEKLRGKLSAIEISYKEVQ